MNSYRPSLAWLPHEPPNGPDSPTWAGWERYTAGMPASLGLRPVLIAAIMDGSLVGSSLLGIENGFGSFRLASNALPQLLIAAWLLIRPGGAAAGPLSAGTLTAFFGLLGFGTILGWVVSRSYTADRRRMETAAMAAAIGAVLSSVLSRSLTFFALYEFRGDCLSHLDAQPIETSAWNPWVLRAAGAGLR